MHNNVKHYTLKSNSMQYIIKHRTTNRQTRYNDKETTCRTTPNIIKNNQYIIKHHTTQRQTTYNDRRTSCTTTSNIIHYSQTACSTLLNIAQLTVKQHTLTVEHHAQQRQTLYITVKQHAVHYQTSHN